MAETRIAGARDDAYDPDARNEQFGAPSARAIGGVPGRRTVTIRGQGAERYRAPTPRRPAERRHERAGFRPDRMAMWAVLLGVLLILVAVTSAHAATF
jgi:hypothetical protein